METAIRAIPWIVMGILFFVLFYWIHRQFQVKSVWENVVKRYKNSVDGRIENESTFVSMYGSIENKSVFYKLDRMILTSGIKKYLPHLNGEVFWGLLLFAIVGGTALGVLLTGNWYIGLFLGAVSFVALYTIVFAMSGRTYNQIEDATSVFVSILSNHAKGSSDIVTIMSQTHQSVEGALRELIGRFLLDAEQTGNVDIAFDYMKESTDNRQLQTILVNLKNCMHYQANYEEVLAQMMGQIAANLSAREERKNILFSMKLTLIIISIASVFIVWVIGQEIGVDVKAILTGNMVGQGILFITGVLYLLVAVKLFGTDK